MNREEIVSVLQSNVCEVCFTKVNGEERRMPCTLREDILPPQEVRESTRKANPDVVCVWVTDIDQWRSFRVDSVQYVHILEQDKEEL